MLNHITIMGRLTRDPELRRTNSGTAVTSFTLAVDRDFGKNENGEKETDFIDCTAWKHTAEFISKHFTKGRMAVVSGRLQIRNWTDKDGNKRKNAEVVADNVYFGDSKKEASGNDGNPSGYGMTGNPAYQEDGILPPYPTALAQDFAMLEDDDAQLPF
jgi:single-strand DNA-binding protein